MIKKISLVFIILLIIFGIGYWIKTVSGADTGLKDPSATGETFNDWVNPANASSTNGLYAATSNYPSDNDAQDWYDFDFSLPAESTINGIELKLLLCLENFPHNLEAALSWDGGNTYTAVKVEAITQADDCYSAPNWYSHTLGGAVDLWGRSSWSDSGFSNANFRLKLIMDDYDAENAEIHIDHIQVRVYYLATDPPDVYDIQIKDGVLQIKDGVLQIK